jgi:peptidoglycan/LPS O-acetylase OafA/YrhL
VRVAGERLEGGRPSVPIVRPVAKDEDEPLLNLSLYFAFLTVIPAIGLRVAWRKYPVAFRYLVWLLPVYAFAFGGLLALAQYTGWYRWAQFLLGGIAAMFYLVVVSAGVGVGGVVWHIAGEFHARYFPDIPAATFGVQPNDDGGNNGKCSAAEPADVPKPVA